MDELTRESAPEREREALRELSAAAERLARSAKIRSLDWSASGGHRVRDDAQRVRAALERWGRS